LVEIPEERYYLGDLGLNGRILLKLRLKECSVRICTGFIWFRVGPNEGIL
jgi:hypothetical protein